MKTIFKLLVVALLVMPTFTSFASNCYPKLTDAHRVTYLAVKSNKYSPFIMRKNFSPTYIRADIYNSNTGNTIIQFTHINNVASPVTATQDLYVTGTLYINGSTTPYTTTVLGVPNGQSAGFYFVGYHIDSVTSFYCSTDPNIGMGVFWH
jgi:hypothetical protein